MGMVWSSVADLSPINWDEHITAFNGNTAGSIMGGNVNCNSCSHRGDHHRDTTITSQYDVTHDDAVPISVAEEKLSVSDGTDNVSYLFFFSDWNCCNDDADAILDRRVVDCLRGLVHGFGFDQTTRHHEKPGLRATEGTSHPDWEPPYQKGARRPEGLAVWI